LPDKTCKLCGVPAIAFRAAAPEYPLAARTNARSQVNHVTSVDYAEVIFSGRFRGINDGI
jgi:hypothetical protein